MCDKNDRNKNSCCLNDPIGCNASNLEHVIANNINIMNCFKNIKCQVMAYINSLSVEFVQNVDYDKEPLERKRLNTLIENLISGIHQSVRSYTDGQTEPHFQLWVQKITSPATAGKCSDTQYKNETDCLSVSNTTWTKYVPATGLYNLGKGWVDGTLESGCFDANGDATDDDYETCTATGSTSTWNGLSTDVSYEKGNRAILYPNKISLLVDCNKNEGVRGGEIIYFYIPTLQLLYNPLDSSLDIKWGEVTVDKNPIINSSCLFPLLSDESKFKSTVMSIVPPSYESIGENDDSEIWDSQVNIYKFVKNNLLLENVDLLTFISKLDSIIRTCELTNTTLLLKKRMIKYVV